MTQTKLLVGSLSNDLLRVANSTNKGSLQSANSFLQEAHRGASQLTNKNIKKYIKEIVVDVLSVTDKTLTIEKAEKLLMYSVLLQNYSLKIK